MEILNIISKSFQKFYSFKDVCKFEIIIYFIRVIFVKPFSLSRVYR